MAMISIKVWFKPMKVILNLNQRPTELSNVKTQRQAKRVDTLKSYEINQKSK